MIDLFVQNDCPYCKKVTSFLNDNKISFNKYDISDDDNVLRLLTFGGKEQVPFLYDNKNDTRLYESEDIINYISKNYVEG